MRPKSLIGLTVGGVAAVVLVFSLGYYGTVKEFDICTLCGQTRVVRKFQIPFTNLTVFSHETAGQSPAGEVLEQAHLVDSHPHDWKVVYSIGNGQPLMMGPGKYANGVFFSPDVTNYLQVISSFQSKSAIAKYIHAAQQSATPQSDGLAAKTTFLNETLIEPTTRQSDAGDALKPRQP